MAIRKKKKKYKVPSAKVSERLHALRMRFDPNYRNTLWEYLGFPGHERERMELVGLRSGRFKRREG